jgi:hypothetical protein
LKVDVACELREVSRVAYYAQRTAFLPGLITVCG